MSKYKHFIVLIMPQVGFESPTHSPFTQQNFTKISQEIEFGHKTFRVAFVHSVVIKYTNRMHYIQLVMNYSQQ